MKFKPKTTVPRPRDQWHRRQLMVDAIASLDMAAMHTLVTRDAATITDVQQAITQTDRGHDEVMDAYTDWLTVRAVTARAVDRVQAWIRQLPIEGIPAA